MAEDAGARVKGSAFEQSINSAEVRSTAERLSFALEIRAAGDHGTAKTAGPDCGHMTWPSLCGLWSARTILHPRFAPSQNAGLDLTSLCVGCRLSRPIHPIVDSPISPLITDTTEHSAYLPSRWAMTCPGEPTLLGSVHCRTTT